MTRTHGPRLVRLFEGLGRRNSHLRLMPTKRNNGSPLSAQGRADTETDDGMTEIQDFRILAQIT